ncbi:MAG: protein phosphatase, partial [Planctomycetia bacterium]|nr:protein phosphatase [Planctomycetia bacterium]
LRDPRPLLAVGVEAVIELADSESFARLPRELIHCRFPLCDGGENPPWLLRLAAETVAALIRERVPTLVACASGLSRSVCVTAGGVALAEGLSLKDALVTVVGTGHADVSPGLLAQFGESLSR